MPFDWSSDYEIAVVYITSMWSELGTEDPADSALMGIIAKNGYLSYCVRFKMELAAWAQSVSIHIINKYIYIYIIIRIWRKFRLLVLAGHPFSAISRCQYVSRLTNRRCRIIWPTNWNPVPAPQHAHAVISSVGRRRRHHLHPLKPRSYNINRIKWRYRLNPTP